MRTRPGRAGLSRALAFVRRSIRQLGMLALIPLLAIAETPPPDPDRWTRELASIAIGRTELGPTVRALYDLTLVQDEAGLLELLETTRQRPDWLAPARDAAIFQYTRSLARLPADAVPTVALDYLRRFEPQTMVPHHDHPYSRVPLLNIRAAAQGLEHGWLRQEAALEGLALLAQSPGGLIDAYLIETHPAIRAGYLDALAQVHPARAAQVSRASLERFEQAPELSRLAGEAALLAGDLATLQAVMTKGSGPGLAQIISGAAAQQSDAALTLLQSALNSGAAEPAALAIAQLYPVVAGIPDAEAALLTRLGDAQLGSAAALALAQSPSRDTQQALEALAASTDRPAARRARLALDLQAQGLQRPGAMDDKAITP
ncbi:MAG: hypothetical protein AAGH19_01980 [Pseudomonadota bacterium]